MWPTQPSMVDSWLLIITLQEHSCRALKKIDLITLISQQLTFKQPRKHHGNLCPNGRMHCVKLAWNNPSYTTLTLYSGLTTTTPCITSLNHSNTFQHAAVNFSCLIFSKTRENWFSVYDIIRDKHPHDHKNTN